MNRTATLILSGTIMATAIAAGYVASNAHGTGGMMRMAQGMGQGHGMGMRGMGMRRGMGGMGRGMGMGQGMGQHRQGGNDEGNRVRHRVVRFEGLPPQYASLQSPLKVDAASIKAGKELFADNCASCHGEKGLGDGEAGKELNPKPANLAMISGKWIATDGFYMWAISEGGEKLKTDMPAFKDALSETERWQIINYLKNGFGG